jgi:purine-binding chemotaxis protein CheW
MDINASDGRELITFLIGREEFSVDIMSIREIRGWTSATPLPNAPPFIRGVINLRGAVLSIVDLAARLGFAPTEPTPRHVIIVVQIANQVAGLLVDAVTGILTVKPDAVLPMPNVGADLANDFLQGILAIDDRMISVIGLENVLPAQAAQGPTVDLGRKAA